MCGTCRWTYDEFLASNQHPSKVKGILVFKTSESVSSVSDLKLAACEGPATSRLRERRLWGRAPEAPGYGIKKDGWGATLTEATNDILRGRSPGGTEVSRWRWPLLPEQVSVGCLKSCCCHSGSDSLSMHPGTQPPGAVTEST